MIKILIVSDVPWNDSNSFGSSFSNIFGGNPNYEIANIYLKPGLPSTKVCSRFFRITERSIIDTIAGKRKTSGEEVYNSPGAINADGKIVQRAKILRWQIMFWLRDCVWATNRWKSAELEKFILDFNPDVIFQPVFFEPYINNVGLFAKKLTNKPMVGYISDDNYTLRYYSLSPFKWINRLIKRKYVKKTIGQCKLLYTIIDKQKTEYQHYFDTPMKVLYKGGDFTRVPDSASPVTANKVIKFVYTGNIYGGRWETLAEIAKALHHLRDEGIRGQLEIYSGSPTTPQILKALNINGVSEFKGFVDSSKVPEIQSEADVLIHVESFNKSQRYSARLSFSTKIVDYLATNKPILAVGWEETGGVEYLKANNAAEVVTDLNCLVGSLRKLISDAEYRKYIAGKAYECGRKNHQSSHIRQMLENDLLNVINSSSL